MLVLTAFIALLAHTQAVPRFETLFGRDTPLHRGDVISFFGDSITWQGGFVDLLSDGARQGAGTEKIAVTFAKHGINGGKSNDLLNGVKNLYGTTQAPIDQILKTDFSEVAVVMIGINDVWQGEQGNPPDVYASNLRQLIDRIKQAHVLPVLATPTIIGELPEGQNKFDAQLDRYCGIVEGIGKEEDVTVVDLRHPFQTYLNEHRGANAKPAPSGLLTYDGVHMLPAGNAIIAEQLADGIAKALRHARAGAPVAKPKQSAAGYGLVPWPRLFAALGGTVVLRHPTIGVAEPALAPLAHVLSGEIGLAFGVQCVINKGTADGAAIALEIDSKLPRDLYRISVLQGIKVQGGSYRAIAWGTATVLQLLKRSGTALSVPRVSIEDQPDYPFRAVMLDLARFWQPPEVIRDTIELIRLYKIPYLHLHLSDDQSFTFPSKAFPEAATPGRHYTQDELKELVRYADERGVALVPEIDMPAHSSALAGARPDVFGVKLAGNDRYESLGILNIADEKTYAAIDTLIGELCETFPSSPYIHFGADEVWLEPLKTAPGLGDFEKAHGLAEAEKGDLQELYDYFIGRVADTVTRHGRKPIVWEGFSGTGTASAEIPRDIAVTEWDWGANAPGEIVGNGYPMVNAAWMPLYIVPTQGFARPPEDYYAWDVRSFQHWAPGVPDFVLPDRAPMLGAETCMWEQTPDVVIPLLMPRVPAFAERVWNEKLGDDYRRFERRSRLAQSLVARLLRPVKITESDPGVPAQDSFAGTTTLRLASHGPGTIRFTLADGWNDYPSAASPEYVGPIALDHSAVISARLFSDAGEPLGGITQRRLQKIEPSYRFVAYGGGPQDGWEGMPATKGLPVLSRGVFGKMTPDRVDELNSKLFAKLDPNGLIETRPTDVWTPYLLVLEGQMRVSEPGEYRISAKDVGGLCNVFVDGRRVVRCASLDGTPVVGEAPLQAGSYSFRIEYLPGRYQNELNLLVKTPSGKEIPFETLVEPLSQSVDASKLEHLATDAKVGNPAGLANWNLAFDKPVRVSGGTQMPNVPENAVDGITDNSSGWHTGPYPQWLVVDLERAYDINRIRAVFYYDGTRKYRYTIDASTDGRSWRRVVDMSRNDHVSTEAGDEFRFDTIQARYVRVNLLWNSANTGVHLNEIMVYQAGSS